MKKIYSSLMLLVFLATANYSQAQTASALDFDGSNDRVNASNINIIGASARTLEFWANISSADLNQTAHIVNWGTTNSANSGFGLWMYQGLLRFYGWAGGDYSTGYTMTTGWHHYSVTYDGTTVKTYVDGNATPTTNQTRTLTTPLTPLVIGARVVDYIYPFKGQLDEVRIWNVARTQNEITTTMNCELNGTETGLVGYYKFNEGVDAGNNSAVTTLSDEVVPANNGTLTNFALTGTASNWVSPGGVVSGILCNTPQTASALDFDGSNDRVSAGNINIIGASARTLEFWANISSSDLNQTAHIVNWGTTNSANSGFGLWMYQGILRFYGWAGGDYSTGYTMTTGWHHYSVTYDGTTVKTYVDGNATPTTNQTRTLTTPLTPLVIGARVVDYIYPFNGQIDEVRIWNVARTQNEITTTMNCELNGTETGLVDYYKFNEGVDAGNNSAVTTLSDAVSPANNGTLTNFALTGATSNWVSPGGVVNGISCGFVGLSKTETENNQLAIFPNPNSGVFTIQLNNGVLLDSHYQIAIFNSIGQNVFTINNSQKNIHEIDFSNLPKGIYFVNVNNGKKVYKGKIIIQ